MIKAIINSLALSQLTLCFGYTQLNHLETFQCLGKHEMS